MSQPDPNQSRHRLPPPPRTADALFRAETVATIWENLRNSEKGRFHQEYPERNLHTLEQEASQALLNHQAWELTLIENRGGGQDATTHVERVMATERQQLEANLQAIRQEFFIPPEEIFKRDLMAFVDRHTLAPRIAIRTGKYAKPERTVIAETSAMGARRESRRDPAGNAGGRSRQRTSYGDQQQSRRGR